MAALRLDSDSVIFECDISRHLAMLVAGGGSLTAENKVRWRGH